MGVMGSEVQILSFPQVRFSSIPLKRRDCFILIVCSKGVKNQNKLIAHIAVLLTLIILLSLAGMRLPKSIESGGLGLFRVLSMILTSTLAMIFFIKSFIDARKNKS